VVPLGFGRDYRRFVRSINSEAQPVTGPEGLDSLPTAQQQQPEWGRERNRPTGHPARRPGIGIHQLHAVREHVEDGNRLRALALVHRDQHAIVDIARIQGSAEDEWRGLQGAMHSRPYRKVDLPKAAELPPVAEDGGGGATARQVRPVHEGAEIGIFEISQNERCGFHRTVADASAVAADVATADSDFRKW
jgi:hypothetical protein